MATFYLAIFILVLPFLFVTGKSAKRNEGIVYTGPADRAE